MDKRIQFGVDFLSFMSELISVTNNQDPVAWACTKMFLVDWGFNFEEIQQILVLNGKQAAVLKSLSDEKRTEYGDESSGRIIDFIGL